jgi:chromosome segregation ATPase
MSKVLRRQLADALHELRQKENAIEEAVHERDVRLRDLETENRRLRKELRAAQLDLHAAASMADRIRSQSTASIASIDSVFASGKEPTS